jgi:protein O-GlcNAc transferase
VSPPEFSAHFSERLFQLSRLWTAYTPPMPPPKAAAKAAGTAAVLGSFGSLSKAGDDVLDLWSALLRAFPTTRLVLKDGPCADQGVRDRILTYMTTTGVDASRVEFLQSTPTWDEHMRLYNMIDIVLDTFPYNSATTAFEALLMGAPLVAMRQNWMGGRVSAALVKTLGHSEWIANDKEEYVTIVGELLTKKEDLAEGRRDRQQKVLHSPLCDAVSLSRALEQGFVKMVHDYNARHSAA